MTKLMIVSLFLGYIRAYSRHSRARGRFSLGLILIVLQLVINATGLPMYLIQ